MRWCPKLSRIDAPLAPCRVVGQTGGRLRKHLRGGRGGRSAMRSTLGPAVALSLLAACGSTVNPGSALDQTGQGATELEGPAGSPASSSSGAAASPGAAGMPAGSFAPGTDAFPAT